jgi:transcriptional regulator with XRE-family HTH domain
MTTVTDASRDLRRLRERAGLTRIELAALARCSPSTLANFEHGYIPERSPTLVRIVEALQALDSPTTT